MTGALLARTAIRLHADFTRRNPRRRPLSSSQPWHGSSAVWSSRLDLLDHLELRSRGEKGDCLLPAGAAQVKGWYAVLSGLVKLQSTSSDGRVSAFLGVPAGEWFGEGSALKAEPRRYAVIALRETTLMCLARADFEAPADVQNLAFNQLPRGAPQPPPGPGHGPDRGRPPALARGTCGAVTSAASSGPAPANSASRRKNWVTWWGCRARP
jgi:hypothetical protein